VRAILNRLPPVTRAGYSRPPPVITPLARFAVRHAVPVLVGWVVVVVALGLTAIGVEGKVQPSLLFVPGTESTHWRDVRKGSFNESLVVLLVGPARAIDRQGPRLAAALQARPGTRAISPWTQPNVKQLQALRPSPTQVAISIDLQIPRGGNINTVIGPLQRFVDSHVQPPVRPHLAGIPSLGSEVNQSSIDALHKGEMIAVPILILVVLLIFRSPVAAAIPLLIAGGTVVMGFGLISLILSVTKLDAVVLSAASMLGLALGVDYSLLIVTRFRSCLAEGHAPRQAASIAANTAGRTATFAGVVLLAITVVAFFLSPGSVLLSMAIGMSVVTVLSMLGAVLLAPAMTSLLGHRVNRWQLGGAPADDGGLIARVVSRVSGRAALATGLLAALLALFASPVLGLETSPPDPRELPKHSAGLEAFDALRAAHFGPEIDVALSAPNGTLLDPKRLAQISGLERQISRLPLIKAVTGPGLIADATAEVRRAPKQIGKSRRDLAMAQDELTARSRQLDRARREARRQAGDVARGLQSARALLDNGTALLNAASSHSGDVTRLRTGLTAARDGARQLAGGTRTLSSQAKLLAGALSEIQKRVDALVPAIVSGQTALRDAEARLSLLRVPAQTSQRELQAALAALDRAGTAAQDPAVQEARTHISAALTAVAGTAAGSGLQTAQVGGYSGLDAALAAELALAEAAGKQIDAAVRQAGQFADVMQQVADGAGRLVTPGLSTVLGGEDQLAAALGQASSGVAAVQPQLDALAGGAQSLLSTGGEMLNANGAKATPLLTQLQDGLGTASHRINQVRDQLVTRTGPFQPLRTLRTLQLDSPGFFQSGYLVAAGLDGARPDQRDAIAGIVDSSNGGRKARILVMPNVPTNDPRQDHIVDAVRALTHRFQRATGITAPVGGTAPELTDFERVNRTRVPLIILAICLVTYLALIPILRSVVLPAIAVGLNMLTVAAAFGILTLLFVGDNAPMGGAGKLDVVTVTGIFVVTFALSIDYQVFLLTRMREEYVRTQSHTAAVEFGISKTARVVTGAATIMVSVFVAFALSSFSLIQQLGVGLASAVLIDATIVRLGLLPSIMKMAGDRTWWLPTWLDERLPYLDTEGSMFARDADHLRATSS
jgi:putative drug exporter of the RND superfamily